MLIERCLCGSENGRQEIHHGIRMIRCSCSILRQVVMMSEEELREWYRRKYFDGVYYHSEDQDRRVARLRLDAYQFPEGSRILDVGAGLGCFVEEARSRGLEAWGQDLAVQSESPLVYIGDLQSIAFPPLSFDAVTLHDVLEHVPDPRAMLREIRRILRPGGTLIVDFPRFFTSEGDHHWKRTEHLWMLASGQLSDLLESEGFMVKEVTSPVPSKIVMRARRDSHYSSVRILVPPGIGDGYWVAVKLRGFLESQGIDLPEVLVHDAGPRRSGSFWERVPFVRWGGYFPLESKRAMKRGYRQVGYPIQEDVEGCDFFISLNGSLNGGRSVEEISTPSEWRLPLFRSKLERAQEEKYRQELGPFILTGWWDQGFYSKWLADFPRAHILKTLQILADEGFTIVLSGAAWDVGGIISKLEKEDPRLVSLLGQTSFGDLLSLLSGASGVLGFPAGSTLLGPYFRTPTALLWHHHFPDAFWTNTVAPGSPYAPIPTRGSSPEKVASILMRMIP